MRRRFQTFLGVDLGGGKGKTTAYARLVLTSAGVLEVVEVGTTHAGQPLYDDNLIACLGRFPDAVVAMDAPLTLTACVRCREPVCPSLAACVDPTIVWFRTVGAELIDSAMAADKDRIAAVPNGRGLKQGGAAAPPVGKPRATPYTQRATEVVLHRRQGILPRETLGQGMGPLTARAAHLVRALARHGFALNENLIEVYPKATLHQLFGAKVARRYKRQVGTWETRARVLESLREDPPKGPGGTEGTLEFSAGSGLARESCLQSDHCFDAVMCAYTAFLWARDGWTLPEENREVYAEDGWIWVPEPG